MQKWNARINLVSNADPLIVIQTHFIDSLSCALSSAIKPHITVLDLGTGAGFPGIPLKIYDPTLHVTAVDAVFKKILFLRNLCRKLGLQEVECLASRAEQLTAVSASPRSAGPFDVIVSRAVGSFPYLLTLAAPLLKNDGCLLLQRGPRAAEELLTHADDLQSAGFRLSHSQEICFSWLDHPRYLVELHYTHEVQLQEIS